MKYNLTTTIVVAVIAIAAGFFAGTKYQAKTPTSNATRGQFAQGQTRGNGTARFADGGQVNGTILSADSSTITVKLQDGSSKIVVLGSNTAINKSVAGSASDLTVGARVLVIGTANNDGSVTAQDIQLNPNFRGATPSATPAAK